MSRKRKLNDDRSPFGIIEKIVMKNFMCHSHLTVKFDGNINFVIGNNGSGKSAVLTALIVVLGGKMVSTGRGKNLKNLIKNGCRFAVVEITLRNDGEHTLMKEEYGDLVVIERRFTIEGYSSYKLKDEQGRVVSTKKEDLVRVLDEANLHVDNPLTCLNQELSKNFLHSKSSKDKYTFFLKTTQLEQLATDYQVIQEETDKMKGIICIKEAAVPDLAEVVAQKAEAYRSLAKMSELRQRVEKLKHEKAWSHVRELENDLKPLQAQLIKEEKKLLQIEEKRTRQIRLEAEAKKKTNELNAEASAVKEVFTEAKARKLQQQQLYREEKAICQADTHTVQRLRRQQQTETREVEALKQRIKEMKRNETEDHVMQEYLEKKAQLTELTKERDGLKSELDAAVQENNKRSSMVNEAAGRSRAAQRDLTDKQQRVAMLKGDIENLSAGKQNKLSLYGRKMLQFKQRVVSAYNKGELRSEPRGPLGMYMSVNDMQLVVPVEAAVKKCMFTFLVGNHADENVLVRIRNDVYDRREAQPTIATVKYSTYVYDVSRNKAVHEVYRTVMDLLVVNDPTITNYLIDDARIETCLVIPETQEAIRLVQTGGSNKPRNCTHAYTKDGDEVSPGRFYSNTGEAKARFLSANVEDEIRRKRKILADSQAELVTMRAAQSAAKLEDRKILEELKSSQSQQNQIKLRLNKINLDVRELEYLEEPQKADWREFEDEVATKEARVEQVQKELAGHEEKCRLDREKVEAALEVVNGIELELESLRNKANDIKDKNDEVNTTLTAAKNTRKHWEQSKVRQEPIVGEKKEAVDSLMVIIAESTEKAKIVCVERFHSTRKSDAIALEIDQVKALVEAGEQQHGRRADVIREAHTARETYNHVCNQIKWSKKFARRAEKYLKMRQSAFNKMRHIMGIQCIADFSTLLRQRHYIGDLTFNHEQGTIDISVSARNEQDGVAKDLRSLSGGERSFSTVCFMLALWQVMQSPLRCLDEFDVFMDMANRRVAMDMMVDMATRHPKVQFIFLTPHEIVSLKDSERIQVWRMADPNRAKPAITHNDGDAMEEEAEV